MIHHMDRGESTEKEVGHFKNGMLIGIGNTRPFAF
jgi:hypothetical protein